MKHVYQHNYFNKYSSWSIAALLYSLSFFVKISPNTLQLVLQEDLQLNFQQLGALSASFYYAYASGQIIGAFLSIQFGLIRVFALYFLFFIIGLFLFVNAYDPHTAIAARLLMGLGCSLDFAFCLFLARSFFQKRNFAFFIGLSNFFAVLGGWMAQYPLELMLSAMGWRSIFTVILALFPILGGLLTISLRKTGLKTGHEQTLETSFAELISYRHVFFLILFSCFSMVLPILMIPEMWGSLFLETIYNMSSLKASVVLSYFFVGIASGNILLGLIARHYSTVRIVQISLFLEIIFCTLFIYGGSSISVAILPIICFIIGLSASSLLLFFDLINKTFKEPRLALPALNIFMTVLSASSHPFIGWYLDTQIEKGIPLASAFLQSFVVIPIFLCISFLALSLMQREIYKISEAT